MVTSFDVLNIGQRRQYVKGINAVQIPPLTILAYIFLLNDPALVLPDDELCSSKDGDEKKKLADPRIAGAFAGVGSRFVFGIPRRTPFWWSQAIVDGGALFYRLSISQLKGGLPLSPGLLKGAVVVIGSSRSDGGDWHETPLGLLSGPEILINNLHALQAYRFIGPPNIPHLALEKFAVLLGTVLIFALYWFGAYALTEKMKRARPAKPSAAEGGAAAMRRPSSEMTRRFLCGILRLFFFAFLYILAIIVLLGGIFGWIVFDAGPALLIGSPSEPLLPAFAVVAESLLEGVKAVLGPIERAGHACAARLRRAVGSAATKQD